MKKIYFNSIFTFLTIAISSLNTVSSYAQITLNSDNASNYTTWDNGSNLGTGFTNWDLWTQNTDGSHFAGHFLGDSAGQGFGNINTGTKAFGMYGNPTNANAPQANAQRFLNSTGSTQVGGRSYLLSGQSFKIDLAVAYRNGFKGIDLLDQNFTQLFNFNVANNLYTTTTNADLGWAYSQTSIFQLEVQQTDTNTYTVKITRGVDTYLSGNRTGQFSGFKLYVGDATDGNNLNNLFFNNLQVQKCAVTTTWNGSGWDNGLPNSNKNVVFLGNYTSTANIDACSVLVNASATVTIADSHTFAVENNIEVQTGGNFVFENNASLVQINPSGTTIGNVVFKRNSKPMRLYDYTYWGSPVTGQTLVGFSPLTNSSRFYTFNSITTVNTWETENSANAMNAGKGYAIRSPDDFTNTPTIFSGQFTGVPNNGTIPVSVQALDPGYLNYNLISNPYPSAIDVISLFDNTNLGTLYFWTHNSAMVNNQFSTDDYAIRTRSTGTAAVSGGEVPGLYITSGQGFFASASSTATINFTNAMRVSNNNSQFFRSSSNPLFYYTHINMTNNQGAFKQIALGYREGNTNDYDFGDDAFASTQGVMKFYSIINPYTIGFAINARSYPWTITDQIPLGYSTSAAGDYNITIDHFDAFFTDKNIYLEDTETNTFHNLKNGTYLFTTAAGTFNSRFKIRYEKPLAKEDFLTNKNEVVISSNNTTISIISNKEVIKNIVIYDMLGKIIYENNTANSLKMDIYDLKKSNQFIIIKTRLETNQEVISKYIF